METQKEQIIKIIKARVEDTIHNFVVDYIEKAKKELDDNIDKIVNEVSVKVELSHLMDEMANKWSIHITKK